MKIFLYILLLSFFINAQTFADFVLVDKSDRKLYLYSNGKVIKIFNVSFGGDIKGPKVKKGDKKTPEGIYYLDYKNPRSRFYKSIHISYPNKKDRQKAKELGVDPGGDIMIHGQVASRGDPMIWFKTVGNWTAGCIALSNKDMDELWKLIKIPTKIKIQP